MFLKGRTTFLSRSSKAIAKTTNKFNYFETKTRLIEFFKTLKLSNILCIVNSTNIQCEILQPANKKKKCVGLSDTECQLVASQLCGGKSTLMCFTHGYTYSACTVYTHSHAHTPTAPSPCATTVQSAGHLLKTVRVVLEIHIPAPLSLFP